jgi:quercetin dioxygenase-like cupin family protein
MSDFADELEEGHTNFTVGTALLYENDVVRVWNITLAPRERLPFHRHRTSYFYRSHAAGMLRVRVPDGSEAVYTTGVDEVHFHQIGPDNVVVHDLENVGATTISFTTVELLRH